MEENSEEKKVSLGGAIITCVITLIIGVFVGINWDSFSGNILPYLGFRSTTPATNNWTALDEVYNELRLNYDGEVSQDVIIEGAKKGLVEAIGDAYTVYMTPEESTDYQASLHGDVGSGIGVEIGLRDGYVRVLRTLPDNPAKKAGILAGDIIYKIDDEEVYAESTDIISQKLHGTKGSKVKVTVVRDGEEKSFDLTREVINNVSAYAEYAGDTAIIKVNRFDTDTGKLVQDIVASKEFKDKNIKKVILDLRSNGGGYVSAAVDLLSLWIDGDPVLIQKTKDTISSTDNANRGQATLKDMPTIVLVNGSTASASEIVAGALKDYEKATIMGEKTYGKGVVQTLLTLSGGSTLKVTTAHWYTPKGTSINLEGIKPDIEIEMTYDDINANKDPQLDAAKKLKLEK